MSKGHFMNQTLWPGDGLTSFANCIETNCTNASMGWMSVCGVERETYGSIKFVKSPTRIPRSI